MCACNALLKDCDMAAFADDFQVCTNDCKTPLSLCHSAFPALFHINERVHTGDLTVMTNASRIFLQSTAAMCIPVPKAAKAAPRLPLFNWSNDKHIKYFLRLLQKLTIHYSASDTNRMTIVSTYVCFLCVIRANFLLWTSYSKFAGAILACNAPSRHFFVWPPST